MRNGGFHEVCLIGLGYIGLPTAAILASRGIKVIGVDVNPRVVETVNNGETHIAEPDLHHLVRGVVNDGWLLATSSVAPADAFIIAVPTPALPDHRPDVTYVHAAVRSVAPALRKGSLVIIESTCPVGTTEEVVEILANLRPDLTLPGRGPDPDVFVAYCPERVLPGRILTELAFNDRSIGGVTEACSRRAAQLYEIFVKGRCIHTDARTAEMVKLTENAFRDVNIAFANELSIICDSLSVDVWRVIELANLHPRVNVLQPGPGVGGHCIAVDPWFIIHAAADQSPLMRAARGVNDGKPHKVVEKVRDAARARPGARIACLGLTYKADVDDLRESPALEVAIELAQSFPGRVVIVEPHIAAPPPGLAATDAEFDKLNPALERCEIVVLLVRHQQFHDVDPARLAGKAVIDTVGLWRPVTGQDSR
jgi:UDP-N-acetyl-D-mannosaminuronic acid dehydrogenase